LKQIKYKPCVQRPMYLFNKNVRDSILLTFAGGPNVCVATLISGDKNTVTSIYIKSTLDNSKSEGLMKISNYRVFELLRGSKYREGKKKENQNYREL